MDRVLSPHLPHQSTPPASDPTSPLPPTARAAGRITPAMDRVLSPWPHRDRRRCVAPPAPTSHLSAGRIIPVMDRVLSPYLRGGGAAAYKSNFQALSTDLLVRCCLGRLRHIR